MYNIYVVHKVRQSTLRTMGKRIHILYALDTNPGLLALVLAGLVLGLVGGTRLRQMPVLQLA